MGTVREHGYREYSDDLTPGKGGQSNLLFDQDGALTAHAPFFANQSDDGERNSDDGAGRVAGALAAIGAAFVAGAAVVGVVKGTKRTLATIRARRRATPAGEPESESPVDATADTAAHVEPDADDALIEEVLTLCAKTSQPAPENPKRREDVDQEPEAEPTDRARARALRSRSGA